MRKQRTHSWGAALVVSLGLLACSDGEQRAGPSPVSNPKLEGRAILPVNTIAPGPASGTLLGPGPTNGVTLPFAGQVVQGFSAVIDGRRPGEYLAMPDNGFGRKENSRDFLLRAYWIRPAWKTASGGSGSVEVGDFIQLHDPDRRVGFPIVNENTPDRLLTGADLDPESVQRARDGTLWFGDEFGPFIVHTDATGKLLEAPFALPNLKAPTNPFLIPPEPATQPNGRGIEAMAISEDGQSLYASLEGPTVGDPDQRRRPIFEFSTVRKTFSGRTWQYRAEDPSYMVADMSMLDEHRFMVIERDGGSGAKAAFRKVYLVDLRNTGADGYLQKTELLDLARIPDPDRVSLPARDEGDIGLGDPFSVVCESVEAIHVTGGGRLVVGCDNNVPNTGRNPRIADNNEFVLVRVPALDP